MDRPTAFRRFLHCLMALAPAYYLLPVDLPVLGMGRWVLLIVFISAVVLVEGVRLLMGWSFFGLRPHERNQIASFVWAAAAVTAALWLFREDVATAAIVGWAFVDPLAGELRRRSPRLTVTVAVPALAYAALAAPALLAWDMMSLPSVAFVSAVGAVAAVTVERQKVRYIDDDFLMVVVPCLLMQLLSF
jgi:dolichol kinase